MVKLVMGTHGDEVKVDSERNVSIHRGGDSFPPILGARNVGKAKTVSKAGKPLEAIAPGIVPESASSQHLDVFKSQSFFMAAKWG